MAGSSRCEHRLPRQAQNGHTRLIPDRVTRFAFALPVRAGELRPGESGRVGGGRRGSARVARVTITRKQFSSTYTQRSVRSCRARSIRRPEDVAGQDEMEESGQEAEAARARSSSGSWPRECSASSNRTGPEGLHELHHQWPAVLVGTPVPPPEHRPRLPPALCPRFLSRARDSMRRILIAGFAALFAVALIAPAAQAKTQFRSSRTSARRATPKSSSRFISRTGTGTRSSPAPGRLLPLRGTHELQRCARSQPLVSISLRRPRSSLRRGSSITTLRTQLRPTRASPAICGARLSRRQSDSGSKGPSTCRDFDSTSSMNCATLGAITYAATPCRNPNVDSSLPPCYGNY